MCSGSKWTRFFFRACLCVCVCVWRQFSVFVHVYTKNIRAVSMIATTRSPYLDLGFHQTPPRIISEIKKPAPTWPKDNFRSRISGKQGNSYLFHQGYIFTWLFNYERLFSTITYLSRCSSYNIHIICQYQRTVFFLFICCYHLQ